MATRFQICIKKDQTKTISYKAKLAISILSAQIAWLVNHLTRLYVEKCNFHQWNESFN